MSAIEKKLDKEIQRLVNIAFEREANRRLQNMSDSFDDWKNDLLGGSELLSLVQEFVRGQADRMFGMYDSLDPKLLIARAVVEGFLNENEIPKMLRDFIKKTIILMKEQGVFP